MKLRRCHVIAFVVGFLGATAWDLFAGTIQEVYAFPSPPNPLPNVYPNGLTLGSDGALYGTTANGGSLGGDIFRFTLNGGLVTLTNFSNPDGARTPQAPIIQGSDGEFYGTTI